MISELMFASIESFKSRKNYILLYVHGTLPTQPAHLHHRKKSVAQIILKNKDQ